MIVIGTLRGPHVTRVYCVSGDGHGAGAAAWGTRPKGQPRGHLPPTRGLGSWQRAGSRATSVRGRRLDRTAPRGAGIQPGNRSPVRRRRAGHRRGCSGLRWRRSALRNVRPARCAHLPDGSPSSPLVGFDPQDRALSTGFHQSLRRIVHPWRLWAAPADRSKYGGQAPHCEPIRALEESVCYCPASVRGGKTGGKHASTR